MVLGSALQERGATAQYEADREVVKSAEQSPPGIDTSYTLPVTSCFQSVKGLSGNVLWLLGMVAHTSNPPTLQP